MTIGNQLKRVVAGALVASAILAASAFAATVTVAGSDPYVGYMNVFNLPGDGGAYQFGSVWGTADLCASFTGNDLRLSPNTIGDPNPYWYIGGGGPGAQGNKIMEANMYVETNGVYPGQSLTFTGTVISNNLAVSHVARAFIRDFAPDYSSSVDQFVVLPASGNFAITLNTINDPGRHVQYGFQMTGPNVWVTDVAPYGAVVVGPLAATPTQNSTWGQLKALYR